MAHRSGLVRILTAALVGTCLLGLAAGCSRDAPNVVQRGHAQGWKALAEMPLTGRTPGVAAWTGDEVIVVGGDLGEPCAPTADCVRQEWQERDGAALDPATGRWRMIAEAPAPVPTGASSAVLDGVLFVAVPDLSGSVEGAHWSLLSFDPAADAWTRWAVPTELRSPLLVAHEGRLIAYSGTDESGAAGADMSLDPATGEWTTLPDDPIGPAFDRSLTSTAYGLVLTAKELVPSPGATEPSVVVAAVWDGDSQAWTRLPDSDQVGGWLWTWTGRHLLDLSLGAADGGEVGNWGRSVPMGGILTLPEGTWKRLPAAPASGPDDRWRVPDAVGSRYSTSGGYLYDDELGSWTVLGRPEGSPDEPGTALWAGDQLVLLGGVDWDEEVWSTGGGRRSTGTWLLDPESISP